MTCNVQACWVLRALHVRRAVPARATCHVLCYVLHTCCDVLVHVHTHVRTFGTYRVHVARARRT